MTTSLFQWFREIGWKDQDAVLRFPTILDKPQRKQVHEFEIAQSFGLGTSSSGFGETVQTFYILNNYSFNMKCIKFVDIWNQYYLEIIMLLTCVENHSVSVNSREGKIKHRHARRARVIFLWTERFWRIKSMKHKMFY